ncbi:MAG: hypothetical protein ACOC8P_03015 [Dichotomicrobium sp.]
MEAYRSSTPTDWLGNHVAPGGIKRLRDDALAVLRAIKTGLDASSDYERLSARNSREDASRMVFEKHFSAYD